MLRLRPVFTVIACACNLTIALPSPIAYWDFEEGGGTQVVDKSGNGHNGTITGSPVWTSGGVKGNSLYFNGSTHVTIPASSAFSSLRNFTLIAWVWQDAQNTDWPVLEFAQANSYSGVHVWVNALGDLVVPGNAFANLRVADSSFSKSDANGFSAAGGTVPVGKWNQLTLTYDSLTCTGKIYVNGGLVVTKTIAAGQIPSTKGALYFGWRPSTSKDSRRGAHLVGRLDEVRIYSSVFNGFQIDSMCHTDGRSSKLVAHWDFDEGFGATLHDVAGNGHDGAITGNPTWGSDGIAGGSLHFDGATHVEIPASPDFSALRDFTFSAWVWQEIQNVDLPVIEFSQPGTWTGLHMWTNTAGSSFIIPANVCVNMRVVNPQSSNQFYTTTGTVPIHQWTHLALTFDSLTRTGRVYVNGALGGSLTMNVPVGQFPSTEGSLFLGWRRSTQSNDSRKGATFSGRMDDVRIYSEGLTAQEVASLYGGYNATGTQPNRFEDMAKLRFERNGNNIIVLRGLGKSRVQVSAYTSMGRNVEHWNDIVEGRPIQINSAISGGGLLILRIQGDGKTAWLSLLP